VPGCLPSWLADCLPACLPAENAAMECLSAHINTGRRHSGLHSLRQSVCLSLRVCMGGGVVSCRVVWRGAA